MKDEPEKPIRYGVLPVGLCYLGYFVLIGVMTLLSSIFHVLRWILDWLE